MGGPRRNPHPQLQRRLHGSQSPLQAAERTRVATHRVSAPPGPGGAHAPTLLPAGLRGCTACECFFSGRFRTLEMQIVGREGRGAGERSEGLRGHLGPSEPRRWAAERTGHEPPCRPGLGSVQQEATAGARWACAGPALLVLPVWLRGEHGEQGDPGPGPAAGPLLSQRGHSRPFCVSWAPSEPSFPKTSPSPGSAARWVDDICGAQASSHPHSQGLQNVWFKQPQAAASGSGRGTAPPALR